MEDLFLKKIKKTDSCWLWTGAIATTGYGIISIKDSVTNRRKSIYAHRVSFTLFKGDIPGRLVIDHLCMNKICVNPEHLEAVTTTENTLRYFDFKNGSRNICSKGHPFDNINSYRDKRGHRRCKSCGFDNSRISKQKLISTGKKKLFENTPEKRRRHLERLAEMKRGVPRSVQTKLKISLANRGVFKGVPIVV